MTHRPEEQEIRFLQDPEYRRLRRAKIAAQLELIEFAQRMAYLIREGRMVQGDATWEQWQTQVADPIRQRLADINEELNRYRRFWSTQEQ